MSSDRQEMLHRLDFIAGRPEFWPEELKPPRRRARHAAKIRLREAELSGWPVETFLSISRRLERISLGEMNAQALQDMDREAGGTGSRDVDELAEVAGWLGGTLPGYFVHPAQRALHVHEFLMARQVFGERTGTMAGLLVRWLLVAQGYPAFDHIELSRVGGVPRGTDENALVEWLRRIHRAVALMRESFSSPEDGSASDDSLPYAVRRLNPRQRDVLSGAQKDPRSEFTLEAHQRIHHVAYATARADLYDLRDAGFLVARKRGKAWVFSAATGSEAESRDIPATPGQSGSSGSPRDWRVW